MPEDKSGPSEGVKGKAVKGKAKEAVGAVTGNDSLSREAGQGREPTGSRRERSSGRESSRESVHGRSATTVRAIAEGARWLDLACNQEELFHAVTANRPRFAVLAGA